MSVMHMAWMRGVCGRLEGRFRYSNKVVYNNFPWPTPTDKQRAAIETAPGYGHGNGPLNHSHTVRPNV